MISFLNINTEITHDNLQHMESSSIWEIIFFMLFEYSTRDWQIQHSITDVDTFRWTNHSMIILLTKYTPSTAGSLTLTFISKIKFNLQVCIILAVNNHQSQNEWKKTFFIYSINIQPALARNVSPLSYVSLTVGVEFP